MKRNGKNNNNEHDDDNIDDIDDDGYGNNYYCYNNNSDATDNDFGVTFMRDRIRYKTLCDAFERQRSSRVVPVQWVGEYYDLLAIDDRPTRNTPSETGFGEREFRPKPCHRRRSRSRFANDVDRDESGSRHSESSSVSSPLSLLRLNDDAAVEHAVRYYHDRWIWLSMLMFGINPCGNRSEPNMAAGTDEQHHGADDVAEIVSEPIRQDASAQRERAFLLRFFEQDLRRGANTVDEAEPADVQHRAESAVALAICGRLTKSNEIMARRLYSDFARLATESLP